MEPTPPDTRPGAPSLVGRVWRGARALAVAVFICWNLFFLLFRNPMDLWYEPIKEWTEARTGEAFWKESVRPVDRVTEEYGRFMGIHQGWSMFAAPMYRHAAFPAARLEFTDGTSIEVYSENEPYAASFFRVGGWRQRKLEARLVWKDREDIVNNEELPLWQAYARWCLRRYQTTHPHDDRVAERIVLFRRRYDFALPETPAPARGPEAETIATFAPDGTLQ